MRKELKRLLIQYALEDIKERDPILHSKICRRLGGRWEDWVVQTSIPILTWRKFNRGIPLQEASNDNGDT